MNITEDEIPRVPSQIENPSESSGNITDLDTRHTDNRSYDYLHRETKERRYRYLGFSYSIEVIYEAHTCQNTSENEHDKESLL